jgi:hypothetical protein
MVRRVLLPLLVVCASAAFAPGAFAANPPCSPVQPASLSSAHFTVTFNDDPANVGAGPAITALQAGSLLQNAEQSYNALTALGFPAPVTGGGGKTLIHVVDLTTYKLSSMNCFGEINFDSGTLASADQTAFSTGFDVFQEIEWSYGSVDGFLMQGAAAWAGWKSLGYPPSSTVTLGPWEMSLDCMPPSLTSQECGTDGYTNLGESRWPFYEYLAEQYGVSFISTLLTATNSAGGNGLAGLQNALAAKSTTLAAAYGGFTTKLLAGNWSALQLNLANVPVAAGAKLFTGTATGDVAPLTFGVDHLATRFVQIDRGAASPPLHCYAATLTLNVALPSAVVVQPVFYWAQAGSSPLPLTVNGSNATATLPWDTCGWKVHGYLSLPNPTTSVNAALFTVSGHLDVSKVEVTATPPTTPANGYGPSTDVNSTSTAPLISFFGPLLLTLPASSKQLQLVVAANQEGTLRATLGSLDLGQRSLVPGENVVTFALPAGFLQTLRRSSTVHNVLTLSPVSSDGKVTGTPVAISVAVEPAHKKPKAKKKKH